MVTAAWFTRAKTRSKNLDAYGKTHRQNPALCTQHKRVFHHKGEWGLVTDGLSSLC